MSFNKTIIHDTYYEMYPEAINLDIPGVDNFIEFHGIYITFQPNINSPIPGAGRWVITNNITNPKVASIAYYDDAYYRIDQAIDAYKKELNESN